MGTVPAFDQVKRIIFAGQTDFAYFLLKFFICNTPDKIFKKRGRGSRLGDEGTSRQILVYNSEKLVAFGSSYHGKKLIAKEQAAAEVICNLWNSPFRDEFFIEFAAHYHDKNEGPETPREKIERLEGEVERLMGQIRIPIL